MYFRVGRLSGYLNTAICWLRIRDRQMKPSGFLFSIGKETVS